MADKAIFEGLVFDEEDNMLTISYVGGDACYVIDDDGFLRHIPSEQIDCQILAFMRDQVKENKDIISEQAVSMLGQNDIFTKAVIDQQLENIDDQMQQLVNLGISESARAYMGMLGFKIVVNHHGEIVRLEQPTAAASDDE